MLRASFSYFSWHAVLYNIHYIDVVLIVGICVKTSDSEHMLKVDFAPNVPQFPDTQQTYTEPSIVPEDDNTRHQRHHIPGDLTYHKPTDDSAYHITIVLQMLTVK